MWFKKKLNNKAEATELLNSEVSKSRSLDYEELLKWITENKREHYELQGKSGITYQLELSAMWDDKKAKTIRFCGSIDGGDVSAFLPMTNSFIKASDGKFVGE